MFPCQLLNRINNAPEKKCLFHTEPQLEKWADRNLRKFTMGKCKILHLGRKNYRHHTFRDLTDYRVAWQKKIYTYKNVLVYMHTSEGRVQWGWSQALFSSDWWQKPTGRSWNTGGSLWTSGNTFSLSGWLSTGRPDKLCSLHPWKHSKAMWTWSQGMSCR